MKHLYKKWRGFLLNESIGEYSIGGRVRLYHYSKTSDAALKLDPEYFLTQRGHYSRNDYNVSDMSPNIDRILRSLAGRPRKSLYGKPPESILPPDAQQYKGAYYKTGGMGVVVWFDPIEVRSFTLQ